jgi:hypothetical protein
MHTYDSSCIGSSAAIVHNQASKILYQLAGQCSSCVLRNVDRQAAQCKVVHMRRCLQHVRHQGPEALLKHLVCTRLGWQAFYRINSRRRQQPSFTRQILFSKGRMQRGPVAIADTGVSVCAARNMFDIRIHASCLQTLRWGLTTPLLWASLAGAAAPAQTWGLWGTDLRVNATKNATAQAAITPVMKIRTAHVGPIGGSCTMHVRHHHTNYCMLRQHSS